MTWTELAFGKYTGLTLPRVLFTHPGWFFWVHPKATRIRVPGGGTDGLVVEYVLDPRAGGLAVAHLVPKAVGVDRGGSRSFTRPCIDLSTPSQLAPYDKTGGKIVVNLLKVTCFGRTSHKMTGKRCAAFFDGPFQPSPAACEGPSFALPRCCAPT